VAQPQPSKVSPADVRLKDGVFITKSDPAKQASFKEVTGRMGWRKRRHLVIGKGKRLDNPKGRKVDIFGAHFVEVEVDAATESVRVALGGVAPLPLRVKKAERALIGKKDYLRYFAAICRLCHQRRAAFDHESLQG
jgi:hypothetical protein